MLIAATALLAANEAPTEADVIDAIGGVLCRCSGYRKIVRAVLDSLERHPSTASSAPATAVGRRIARLDGVPKVDGTEVFGADKFPEGALIVRAVRSPYHHARFKLGDLSTFLTAHPGIVRIFTAKDVTGKKLLWRHSGIRRSAGLRGN
jgi:aldehyde oxidoreductase